MNSKIKWCNVKYIICKLFILFLFDTAFGQEEIHQTNSFFITGKVKKNITINIDSLKKYPLQELVNPKTADYALYFMHAESLKGVLLKSILSHITFDLNNSKQMRDVSFIFIGSDGIIGFSWNELFNSEIGDNLFIIMEVDKIKAEKIPESIQITSMLGYKSGRRYLRNLSQIMVMQLNQK